MADPAVPFSWRCERARAGSGALGDLGSHAISVARFLGGPIVEVLGDTAMVVPERAVAPPGGDLQFGRVEQPSELRRVENEDIAHCLFRFASGVLGSLTTQPHRLGPQERPRPRALRHAGRGALPPGALQRVRAVPRRRRARTTTATAPCSAAPTTATTAGSRPPPATASASTTSR